MSALLRQRAGLSFALPLLWGIAALAVGLLIGTQPPAITALLLGSAAFALAGFITPFAALVIMLVLAPLRALIATESPVQLPLDVGQLALVALLAFWVSYRIVHERRLPRILWSPVLVPVLIFFISVSASAFSAFSIGSWLSEWLKWAQVILLIIVCLDLARDHAWEWLIFALVLSGLANSLIGIYEFLGGSGALHLLIGELSGVRFRAFGTFGQPNPFGGFMGLIAPVALAAGAGYALRAWKHWRFTQRLPLQIIAVSLFYAGAGALLSIGVIVSWSRGAWLAFAASMAVAAFALPRRFWHSLLLVGVVGLLAGGLWLSGRLPASIVSRVQSAFEETFSTADVRGVDITSENYALVERLAHWQAAVNMATDHPWLGVGFGNYETAYPQYRLVNWKFPLGHAHNYYLNVLAETGIIGLIAYLLLWIGIIVLTWFTRRHPDPLTRCCAIGLLGSWTYLAVHSLTDSLYVNNLFLHLGIMIGTLSVLVNQMRSQHLLMRSA